MFIYHCQPAPKLFILENEKLKNFLKLFLLIEFLWFAILSMMVFHVHKCHTTPSLSYPPPSPKNLKKSFPFQPRNHHQRSFSFVLPLAFGCYFTVNLELPFMREIDAYLGKWKLLASWNYNKSLLTSPHSWKPSFYLLSLWFWLF